MQDRAEKQDLLRFRERASHDGGSEGVPQLSFLLVTKVAFTFRDFPVRRLTCAGFLLGISGAGHRCLRLKREVTEANISCGTLHSSVVLRSQRRVRGENLASKPATTYKYVPNRTNASNERIKTNESHLVLNTLSYTRTSRHHLSLIHI